MQAIRHKARSIKHFNQRHVHLGDNLGMVLAFDRGRAKSPQLLFCCRKAAAYSVATNSIVHHRWVPSEWNAADGPSRQWESQATDTGPSKRSKKKALDQILYPSTREKKQAIQQHFRDSVGSAGAQGCCGPGVRALTAGERQKKRASLQLEAPMPPRFTGQTQLEILSVSPKTATDYRRRVMVFQGFCRLRGLRANTASQVDLALTELLNQ